MALAGTEIALEYIHKCVPDAEHLFRPRFEDLTERLVHGNELHEAYLAEIFNRSSDDIERQVLLDSGVLAWTCCWSAATASLADGSRRTCE